MLIRSISSTRTADELTPAGPRRSDTGNISATRGKTETGTPRRYHVVAVAGDKTIGETTISLEPQVTITDVIWAQNNPDMDWEKSGSAWQQFAALTVKNTGNAPTYLTAVEWRNSPQAKVSASETVTTNLNRLLSPGDDHLHDDACLSDRRPDRCLRSY